MHFAELTSERIPRQWQLLGESGHWRPGPRC